MFEHFGRFGNDGWWWPGLLMPILFLVLIGVGVWAIVRATSRGPVAAGPPLPPPARDPALEEVRLRYARGEIDHAEFVSRSRDLGGTVPDPEPIPPQAE